MSACNSCDNSGSKGAGSLSEQTKQCPSRMDYGWLTDYSFRCAQNSKLNGMVPPNKSAYVSRMYLQENAVKIMAQERLAAEGRLAPCAPCKRANSDPGTMLPEKYVVRCNDVTCASYVNDPNGLGVGR